MIYNLYERIGQKRYSRKDYTLSLVNYYTWPLNVILTFMNMYRSVFVDKYIESNAREIFVLIAWQSIKDSDEPYKLYAVSSEPRCSLTHKGSR